VPFLLLSMLRTITLRSMIPTLRDRFFRKIGLFVFRFGTAKRLERAFIRPEYPYHGLGTFNQVTSNRVYNVQSAGNSPLF
jgi:hypothetical protein